MANKDSNISIMNKNKETIKKVSAKVHEELLNTSHLFIDETVATLTRMQKITGKVIKKSEPLLEKQIEITFEAVEALKDQAGKGGKRALKLFGLTKSYNKLTNTISEKIEAIPSTEKMIKDTKKFVASAKSDVEETINSATDSLKAATSFGEKEISKKAVAKTKARKSAAKKVVAKAKTTKSAAKATSTKVATKAKTIAKSTSAKVTKTAKKVAAPVKTKAATAAKKAVVKPVAKKANIATSELTKIKGIGPSLAAIMNDNGIKTIKDLQVATPTALKIIAVKAGNRYKSFDTTNWIEAAKAISK